jgi:hypothetical protein
MAIHRFVPLALVVVQTVSLATAASAQEPRPPQSVESAQAQDKTVREMRNVGTALFNWLIDQVDNDTNGAANPELDSACASRRDEIGACEVVQIDKLPIISHRELVQILVPRYITVIHEKDGWGNPYEFHLDRKYILNKSVMAIRSSGNDGVFSGNRYDLGVFSPGDANQDLVWMDGFFVRWPERKDIKHPR